MYFWVRLRFKNDIPVFEALITVIACPDLERVLKIHARFWNLFAPHPTLGNVLKTKHP
jgi:hypothetical protein